MDKLIDQLKNQIIEQLNLEDLSPDDIHPDTPLFNSEIGLDSIDALEIIVMLEREYGVKVETKEDGEKIFQTLRTIANYISEKTT